MSDEPGSENVISDPCTKLDSREFVFVAKVAGVDLWAELRGLSEQKQRDFITVREMLRIAFKVYDFDFEGGSKE